jgi:hypothetical protein
MRWQWVSPTNHFSSVVSSTGNPIWRLRVSGTRMMFRAEPIAAVGDDVVITS